MSIYSTKDAARCAVDRCSRQIRSSVTDFSKKGDAASTIFSQGLTWLRTFRMGKHSEMRMCSPQI